MKLTAVEVPADETDKEPVTGTPLREQVVASMRADIVAFRLRPGQRLVERELVERYGVSRTTVREAIRELSADGLVTVFPQRGAVVSAPSAQDAVDLYEIRAFLESRLVQRFVRRADPAHRKELGRIVRELRRASASESEETASFLTIKARFYAVLASGADSDVLAQMLTSIQARVTVLRATSLAVPGRAAQSSAELQAVLEAVLANDEHRAFELMDLHVRAAGRTALGALQLP